MGSRTGTITGNMKVFLCIIAVVAATPDQTPSYDLYSAPTPAPTYSAPTPTYATTPAPTTPTPAYTSPAPSYHAPAKPAYHAEPTYYPDEIIPYTYNYAVADDYSKAVFSAGETSDGASNVEGSYSVNLPDGRVQHVKYHSNGYEGFVADVTYEGEAHYPTVTKYHTPAPQYHAPAPAYHAPAPKYVSAPLLSYQ